MKKSLIIVLAVILSLTATTVVFAKSKKTKIWSNKKLTKIVKSIRKSVTTLQTKVAALEASDLEVKTYEGSIDLTADGDKTTLCENRDLTVTCHWKEISVPELDLTKSPNVQVLLKGVMKLDSNREDLSVLDLPTEGWMSGVMANTGRDLFALDNGKVYILYKADDNTALTDGTYKIILTYKK